MIKHLEISKYVGFHIPTVWKSFTLSRHRIQNLDLQAYIIVHMFLRFVPIAKKRNLEQCLMFCRRLESQRKLANR